MDKGTADLGEVGSFCSMLEYLVQTGQRFLDVEPARRSYSEAIGADQMLESLIRRLRALFGSSREPYRPSADPFLELDLAAVRAQLKPTERGIANGRLELPNSEHVGQDAVERDIVTFFKAEQNRALHQCELQLKSYGERLQRLGIESISLRLSTTARAACADLRSIAGQGSNELFSLETHLSNLAADFETFRRVHSLKREPHYPESLLLGVGILLVVLLLEAVLNGTMLARGNSLGYFGGVTEALAIATLNVGLGYLVGSFPCRYLHHRSRTLALLSSIAILLAAFASVAFNLAVAHYREHLAGQSPEAAAEAALRSVLETPLLLTELSGWLLFFLGLAFSLVAAIDTYKMDDPYPDYGRLHRVLERAQDDFVAERQHLIDQLTEVRDKALHSISASTTELGAYQQQFQVLVQRQQHIAERFRGYEHYLERAALSLLAEYHEANKAARTTPMPRSFATEWHLDPLALALAGQVEPGRQDRLLRASSDRSSVIEAFEAAVSRIEHVRVLVTQGRASGQ